MNLLNGVKMKISSKGRYAVRIMAELAKHPGEYLSVAYLSEKQNISTKYLEKIISMLNKANLIESSRGATGGNKLKQAPQNYTVAQILKATNDLPCIAPCLKDGKNCPMENVCDSIGCWEKLNKLISNYLNQITLENLINKKF